MAGAITEQVYSHASEPRAVDQRKTKKAKYRDPLENPVIQQSNFNLMFDRRVVRGNTYAAHIVPVDSMSMTSTKRGTRRRTVVPRPPGTPNPVEGRRHMDIQTDTYLEELTDIVPEEDIGTQTEAFIDRCVEMASRSRMSVLGSFSSLFSLRFVFKLFFISNMGEERDIWG